MLRFTTFSDIRESYIDNPFENFSSLYEAKEKKVKEPKLNNNASDMKGKAHEIRKAALINFSAEHPKEFAEANSDDEIKSLYHKHFPNGDLSAHIPDSYRDENQKTPAQVYGETTRNLNDKEHVDNFVNTFKHAKATHQHLLNSGFVEHPDHPGKGIAHIQPRSAVWTSQDGDVGKHLRREPNKETDDSDIMYKARHKNNQHGFDDIGDSLKIGHTGKINYKNKTPETVVDKLSQSVSDPEHKKAIDTYLQGTKAASDEHKNTMHSLGFGKKDANGDVRFGEADKNKFKDALGGGQFGAGGRVTQNKTPVDEQKLHSIGLPAFHSSQKDLALHANHHQNLLHHMIHNAGEEGHKALQNHVRGILGINGEGMHNIRSYLKTHKDTGKAVEHQIEDPGDNTEALVNATHSFSHKQNGQISHLIAHGAPAEGETTGPELYRIEHSFKKGSSPASSNTVTHTVKVTPTGKKFVKKTTITEAKEKATPKKTVSSPKKATTPKKKEVQVNTKDNPHWDEKAIGEMLDNVMGNNLVESTDVFKSTLSNKIAARLLEAKKGIYSERFDKDLDKNKNGKLDADDFKKLRASKKQNKCTATCEETVEEGIGSMLGLSTTKGKPDWKKAPKWATHLGRTHEGAFHWLDKNTALTNKSSDSYYPNAGKIKFSGHVDTKKGIGYVEQKPTNEETIKQMEDALNEVLNPSMGVKAYIDDFIKSDDSRFTGDSKEKRRQRAIAAFYNDKK